MALKVAIHGVASILKELDKASKKAATGTKRVIRQGAVRIHHDAVTSIQRGPKTGVKYGNHQASAPGEPPATDTGVLAGSIVIETTDDGYGAQIIARANYAHALEFGTRGRGAVASAGESQVQGAGNGAIAPRPFMFPALEKNREQIEKELAAVARGEA